MGAEWEAVEQEAEPREVVVWVAERETEPFAVLAAARQDAEQRAAER